MFWGITMPAIRVADVSKRFLLRRDRPRSFQELAVNGLRRRKSHNREEVFWALQDVSFLVERGETVGIVGANGAGKSTCLKLLARILEPTAGTIEVEGRVSAILELGSGFHPELTGRENITLYGSILGLRRREMARRFDEIVAFAELERFIDIPVKFYSSGMYVRLAFATAINVSPDILLLDEVLAVGDQSFQKRCLVRINELEASGMTIVFVSHSLDAVKGLCDRALWLDGGTLREDGATEAVVARYLEHVQERNGAMAAAGQAEPAIVSADDGNLGQVEAEHVAQAGGFGDRTGGC
jgi:lipopolysaccharide transport system ATP-binding protein